MKSSDLRVNNWIKLKKSTSIDENNFKLDKFRLGTLLVSANQLEYVEPIQLTEEWFLKFGAVKEPYEDDIDFYYLIIRNKKFDIIYENEDDIFCDIGESVFELKYVHQLQNLYHALTGEELQIKKQDED